MKISRLLGRGGKLEESDTKRKTAQLGASGKDANAPSSSSRDATASAGCTFFLCFKLQGFKYIPANPVMTIC